MASSFPLPPAFSYKIKPQNAIESKTQNMVCTSAAFKLTTWFFLLSKPRSKIKATNNHRTENDIYQLSFVHVI